MKNTYSKFISFLKGLEIGLEIEIDGRTYSLGYDDNDRPRISHKVLTKNSSTGEEKYVYMEGLDLHDINEFILYILKNISEEKDQEINSNIVLNRD